MASSACRARLRSGCALFGLAAVAACGGRTLQPVAGIDLPAGPGRELLLRDCVGCHDLGGLELYRGFYSRDDWRLLVQTMVTHGATTAPAEVETIADYLSLHFGRQP